MKRPVGFTVLAVVLCWVAVPGVCNALIGPARGVFRLLALAYAINAVVTAVGLWMARKWAFTAFLSWGGVMMLNMAGLQQVQVGAPWPLFCVSACFAILLVSLLAFYIRRTLVRLMKPADLANPPPAIESR